MSRCILLLEDEPLALDIVDVLEGTVLFQASTCDDNDT